MSLFDNAAQMALEEIAPLAEKMRPRTLDDVVGQRHLTGPGGPLRKMVEQKRLLSMVLWGPPGCGKTTLAKIITRQANMEFELLSATNAGVSDVHDVINRARVRLGENNIRTALFLDEVHRFTKAQQDRLLPGAESGLLVLIGATTENPFVRLNSALLSRLTLFELKPLNKDDVLSLIESAQKLTGRLLTDEAIDKLASFTSGDARVVLTSFELLCTLFPEGTIGKEQVEAATLQMVVRHSADDHYDLASAFIKSIRGSDVDASLYWLGRLLVAGEDPQFIARRLMILSSEDIGEADSNALVVATSAAQACNLVGFPEAEIILSHATIALAKAPKCNSAITSLMKAKDAVGRNPIAAVPPHLRDSSYATSDAKEASSKYIYPHDHVGEKINQNYLPDEVQRCIYQRP